MINPQYKNLRKLVEFLETKRPFDRLKKMFTILLMVFFIIALTVVAASLCGVKIPGYQQGSEDGYRAGYHTAFDGNRYNVAAGLLGENRSHGYDEGYIHGYDEGYPAGQSDLENSSQLKAGQELETSQNTGTLQDNKTSKNSKTSPDNKISSQNGN